MTKFEQLERQLIEHEGLRLKPYHDTAAPPRLTIGVGRNLDDVGLRSEAEGVYLLRNDIEAIWRELVRRWPTVATLDGVRVTLSANVEQISDTAAVLDMVWRSNLTAGYCGGTPVTRAPVCWQSQINGVWPRNLSGMP